MYCLAKFSQLGLYKGLHKLKPVFFNQILCCTYNVVQCTEKFLWRLALIPKVQKLLHIYSLAFAWWKQCTYIWAIWHISISTSSECKYWLLSKLNMQQDNYWRKNNQIWVLIHCVFPFLFLNVYIDGKLEYRKIDTAASPREGWKVT